MLPERAGRLAGAVYADRRRGFQNGSETAPQRLRIFMRTEEIKKLVEQGKEHLFYCGAPWQHKRAEVLRLDRNECQLCKSRGKYRKACIVHHVKHLKDRPDLALSIYDGMERQLVSLCKGCHEEMHPESKRQFAIKAEPVTQERWE